MFSENQDSNKPLEIKITLSAHRFQTPPVIDTGSLMTLIMGMLGLGGLRTYEKINDVHDNH